MKRIVCIVCILALALSLSACGDGDLRPAPEPAEPAGSAEPVPAHEPAPTPDVTLGSVPEPSAAQDGPFIGRVCGTYVRSEGTEDEEKVEIYSVNGQLMAEFADKWSYRGEEYYPASDAELFSVDDTLWLTALPYDGNSFAGSYSARAFQRGITVTRDGIELSRDGEAPAVYVRTDKPIGDDSAPAFYENTEIPDGAPSGEWCGTYCDDSFDYHTLYVKLDGQGSAVISDRVDGDIPHIMEGACSAQPVGDGAYDVSCVLTERANYKMPRDFSFRLSDEGLSVLFTSVEGDITDIPAGGGVSLYPCRKGEIVGEPCVKKLDGSLTFDLNGDGRSEKLTAEYEYDEYGLISGVTVGVNGIGTTVGIGAWDARAYLMYTGISGLNCVYVDCAIENDYHDIVVYTLSGSSALFSGEFFGGFAEEPKDPYCFSLQSIKQLLSTMTCTQSCRIGPCGLPRALDTLSAAQSGAILTAKSDIDAWMADMHSGELLGYGTIKAGTELRIYAAGGDNAVDLIDGGGTVYRVWLDAAGGWPQSIDGTATTDLFDGIMFAG